MKQRRSRLPIWIVAATSILLDSCQQVKDITGTENCAEPSMSPAQQQLCKDDATYHQTVAGGAAVGGAVGAGTGALACALSGKANPLMCAAIGLGIGLFAGGVTGYIVAKKQQAAKDNKRAIDSVTDDVREQNNALRSQVAAARAVSIEDQKKLARINSATRAGQISAQEAEAQRASIASDRRHLDDMISHLEDRQKNFQSAGQQLEQPSTDYNRQLADMNQQIEVLKKQKDALDRAMSASG
nr:hypothetical protein [uncultured Rhodopila sp.]